MLLLPAMALGSSSLPCVRAAWRGRCVSPFSWYKRKLYFWSTLFSSWVNSRIQTAWWPGGSGLGSAACRERWQQRGWCGCGVKLPSGGGAPWQGEQTLIGARAASWLFCCWLCAPATYLVLGGLSFGECHQERKSKTSRAVSVFSRVNSLFWLSAFLHKVLYWRKGRWRDQTWGWEGRTSANPKYSSCHSRNTAGWTRSCWII